MLEGRKIFINSYFNILFSKPGKLDPNLPIVRVIQILGTYQAITKSEGHRALFEISQHYSSLIKLYFSIF